MTGPGDGHRPEPLTVERMAEHARGVEAEHADGGRCDECRPRSSYCPRLLHWQIWRLGRSGGRAASAAG